MNVPQASASDIDVLDASLVQTLLDRCPFTLIRQQEILLIEVESILNGVPIDSTGESTRAGEWFHVQIVSVRHATDLAIETLNGFSFASQDIEP